MLNSSIQRIKFAKAKHSLHRDGGIKALKHKGAGTTLRLVYHSSEKLAHTIIYEQQSGAELGGCQGGHCPPKILPGPPSGPPKIFRVTSCHCIEVLHRPLTAPLVAKLAPPVAPPNENVWLRPWQQLLLFPT